MTLNWGEIPAVAGIVILGLSPAAQSSVPAIPTKPGLAAGTLQAGATTITLAHAYAAGPIESGGTLYQVILTETPVTANALDTELLHKGGQTLLRAGKLNGVSAQKRRSSADGP